MPAPRKKLADSPIEISGDFDGGNPKDSNNIFQSGLNAFTILPYSEDNDPNYKFRLDVAVTNRCNTEQYVDLNIDWQERRFNYLRHYVFLKHSNQPDWHYIPLEADETSVHGRIGFEPGVTHLCLNPKYNYSDYLSLIDRIPDIDGLSKSLVGETPQGREIWSCRIGTGNADAKKRILLVARIHPYETAGSYCTEGILDHFIQNRVISNGKHPNDILVSIIPMANPDGVYHGFCKLTASDGIDISKKNDPADPSWCILKKAIDQFQPTIYCEFHNWMFPDADGIYFLNWLQARRFIRNMPSQRRFRKNWKPMLRRKLFSIHPLGFKEYARQTYGSLTLCPEYPWRYRTADDMKKLGVDTLNALTNM